ncbi:hypothetical protein HispidOSU_024483, partial [Sigmodon hispidus]
MRRLLHNKEGESQPHESLRAPERPGKQPQSALVSGKVTSLMIVAKQRHQSNSCRSSSPELKRFLAGKLTRFRQDKKRKCQAKKPLVTKLSLKEMRV